ncbi:serine hydrolase domain-containing protein [Gorillibacterium sp. sgz500922]|uniref:serine hydrolase domain-containing protein n=1 Tax=Gorillibacterium sp. sgz500922 TaxID=3446694 RepID=UPI003F67322C
MKTLLDDLVASVRRQQLQVRNVVVRQGGDVIGKHDFEEEQPALLYSVSKTFTSMAVGIAIGEGAFRLDSRLTEFFPEAAQLAARDEHVAALTVHDLLCMGSGHAECPVTKADWSEGRSWDIERLFFGEPFVYAPGTRFTYDNSATYLLSKLIGLTTGVPLDEYLDPRVFRKLGIPKPRWDTCPKGVPQGFSGLHLTAEHLSRFGQLILDQGRWKGEALIPSGYIEQATSVRIATSDFDPPFATDDHHQGYGYQVWMNAYPGSCRMDGLYGQYVVLLPDRNAVVTFVSAEPHRMTAVLELTWTTLLDKL